MSKKIADDQKFLEKILPIRFLLLDVDGVLTDGTICYGSNGDEWKSFNVKDGSGLRLWHRAGHRSGIITGRASPMVLRRAKELEIAHVATGVKDKLPVFEQLIIDSGVTQKEIAVVGDDLMELPLMNRAGLSVAVADAVAEVRDAADFVTNTKGGRGAVREVIELILKAQGRWREIMNRYTV